MDRSEGRHIAEGPTELRGHVDATCAPAIIVAIAKNQNAR
jgi:hypothetical protein